MFLYNKLVRDNIPDIIQKSGKTPAFHTLSENEYLTELDRKLSEECAEYLADKSLEELADILEVIYAICDARGYSTSELESCRKAKAEKRGSFANRIYLENVEDKNG